MIPIYFPYTFVTPDMAEFLAACFGRVRVYQAGDFEMHREMTASVRKGSLDVRVPVKGDEKRIRSVLENYRQWGELHANRDIHAAVYNHQRDSVPFFSGSSIMKIKEDIQRKIRKRDDSQKKWDPLFISRLFLQMAQEFDSQNYDINHGIQTIERREQNLIKNLQGEEGTVDTNETFENPMVPTDPSTFMISERIEAWAGLLLHDENPDGISGIFVTGNQTAFEYIIEKGAVSEKVFDIEGIPIDGDSRDKEFQEWRTSFMKNIKSLAREPWSGNMEGLNRKSLETASDNKVSFRLYIVPNENPWNFFARLYPHQTNLSEMPAKKKKTLNTLLGIVGKQV